MAGISETRTYDALLSTTLAKWRPNMIDQITDDFPALSWLLGKLGGAMRGEGEKRLELIDGGESIVQSVMYEHSSAIKAYSGYETLDLTPQEGMTIARYAWRQHAGSVIISGLEKRNNQGDAAKIKLLKEKTKQMQASFRNRLSSLDLWGANADGKSWDGLATILSTTATLGGLSPTTFAWWVPTIRATSPSFTANGENEMRILFNTISFGNDHPDAIFMTQAIHEYYEASLVPQRRYTDAKAANAGFQNLTFKAVPCFFDRDATSGTITMLNSANIKLVAHKDAYFAMSDFKDPIDQDAESAKCLLQANLVVDERRKHGRITGVTA